MRIRKTPKPTINEPAPNLLRPSEVCELLAVSRSWLYEAARDGRIPSIRLGGPDGPLRLVEADLNAWIDQARRGRGRG